MFESNLHKHNKFYSEMSYLFKIQVEIDSEDNLSLVGCDYKINNFIDENRDGLWNERINPKNVISIVPGYKASNRKFAEDSKLVVADTTNIGNGNTLFRIVNINDIDMLKPHTNTQNRFTKALCC